MRAAQSTPRRVVIVAFEGVQSLDLVGPSEVFAIAARVVPGAYEVRVATADGRPFRASSGLRLAPDVAMAGARGPIDTLLVAGGDGVQPAARDARLVRWVRAAARRSRRVASVCTGAFVLAEAGLLDGRRATTHWSACATLAERYPATTVETDPIFVRDGDVWTSAGVTAGMDLALALVEEDLGREIALTVARWMVLFVKRPGGQAQFSAQLSAQVAERRPLRELQAWLPDHLEDDLSVEALAERACMSPRNFARAWRREVGATPAAYVASLRVERARLLLETTELSLEEIARQCGFGTPETMRRAFARRVGIGPKDHRSRFTPHELGEAA